MDIPTIGQNYTANQRLFADRWGLRLISSDSSSERPIEGALRSHHRTTYLATVGVYNESLRVMVGLAPKPTDSYATVYVWSQQAADWKVVAGITGPHLIKPEGNSAEAISAALDIAEWNVLDRALRVLGRIA